MLDTFDLVADPADKTPIDRCTRADYPEVAWQTCVYAGQAVICRVPRCMTAPSHAS
jgi:hypothetical protein